MNGFILTTHADHNPLIVALRETGVDVRHVTWGEQLPSLSGCLAFYGNLFDEIKDWAGLIRFKAHLKRNCVPYVFWNRDAPWNTGIKKRNVWALKLIKPVDIYLAHSLQDAEMFGGEPHYFPNAAQQHYYQDTDLDALRDESFYSYDVSYFGSFGNMKDRNARLRSEFLNNLGSFLRRAFPGIRMLAIDTSQNPLPLNEQLKLIRTTKINLNIGAMCDLPGNASWGLPERIFGIPAAGGLVVSDVRKHLNKTFLGEVVPTFSSLEDCSGLIEKLLVDWSGIRRFAENQHGEVVTAHTYQQRARSFMKLIAEYREATKKTL